MPRRHVADWFAATRPELASWSDARFGTIANVELEVHELSTEVVSYHGGSR